jgi:hypothetical protein
LSYKDRTKVPLAVEAIVKLRPRGLLDFEIYPEFNSLYANELAFLSGGLCREIAKG